MMKSDIPKKISRKIVKFLPSFGPATGRGGFVFGMTAFSELAGSIFKIPFLLPGGLPMK
jgi:hypothetical protein